MAGFLNVSPVRFILSVGIIKTLNRWNNEYLNIPVKESEAEAPSEEDLARIEEFKKKGWI